MQRDRSAHSIPGLPNCLIDGFKHSLDHIVDPNQRIYFLTHYHSDHYTGLYQGWKVGHIYCSTTTAKLLVNVMKVRRADLIHSVEIGETVTIPGAKVTFLDANHCPGAAILLFQLDSGLTHLHTGDMRYHPRMKEFQALKSAKIDKLFLDTTYAHPKHQFRPQSDAIKDIIRQVNDFLFIYGESGLVYLSAYNLGKERVIFGVQDAIGKPIYMDDSKINIMNQIEGGPERIASGMFTNDPLKSNIHICGMGMAGFVGQYFRANFDSLEANRQNLNELKANAQTNPNNSSLQLSPFTHVLAFIPTGWAESSSYNRSHSYQVQDHLAVQLVAYSEHSQYQELVDFVGFLKPREVVPTVYADDRNRVFIIHLFRNLVDKKQNIQCFLNKFNSSSKGKAYQSYSDSLPSGFIENKVSKTSSISYIDISNVDNSNESSPCNGGQNDRHPHLHPDDVIDLDEEETEDIVSISESVATDTTIPVYRNEKPPAFRTRSSSQTAAEIGSVVQSGCSAPAGGMMNLWLKCHEQHRTHLDQANLGTTKYVNLDSNAEKLSVFPIPSPLSISSSLSAHSAGSSATVTEFTSCGSISLPAPIITNHLSFPNSSNLIPPNQQQHSSKNTRIAAWVTNATTPPAARCNTPNTATTMLYSPSQKTTPRKRVASEVVSDHISQDLCIPLSSSTASPTHNQNQQRSIAQYFYASSPASSSVRKQHHTEGKGYFNQGCQTFDLNMSVDAQNNSHAFGHHPFHGKMDPIIGSIQSYSVDEQELADVTPSVIPSQLNLNCDKENFDGTKVIVSSILPKHLDYENSNGSFSTSCTPSVAMLSTNSRSNSMIVDHSHCNDGCLFSDGPRVPTPSQKKIKLGLDRHDSSSFPKVADHSMDIVSGSIATFGIHQQYASSSNPLLSHCIPNCIPINISNDNPVPATTHSDASSYIVPPTPRGRRDPSMSTWTTSTPLVTPTPALSLSQAHAQQHVQYVPPVPRIHRTTSSEEREKRHSRTVCPENVKFEPWTCHICTFLNQSPNNSASISAHSICAMCNSSCSKSDGSVSLSRTTEIIDLLES